MKTSALEINLYEFQDFKVFTWIFCLLLFGPMIVIFAISYLVDRYNVARGTPGLVPQAGADMSNSSDTNQYALMTIGSGSNYSFLLGSSYVGGAIALVTIVVQFYILVPSILDADYDLSNDSSVLVSTWKCPRDSITRKDKSDINGWGWASFIVLMTFFS